MWLPRVIAGKPCCNLSWTFLPSVARIDGLDVLSQRYEVVVMEMWFVFVAGGLFALGIMVYVLFMVFLPEWVGITGKKAIEAEQSHRGEGPENDDGPASAALARMESTASKTGREDS